MPGHSPASIDASTRYCAVYGFPIRHSASPAMQNAGLSRLGLNWRYLAFEVPPANLREALAGAAAMRFIGVNLTVPHKLFALPMMDCLDETARRWGAVNTVRFEGLVGNDWIPLAQLSEQPHQIRTHGFNTDADAIVRSIQEDLQFVIKGASILLLGAGGAGRVAALRFAAEQCRELYLVNRTQSKSDAVLLEIRALFPGLKVHSGYPPGAVDLVVNATSLGLREDDELPFDRTRFKLAFARHAYDMVYRPAQTPFLRAASEAGVRSSNGIGMLLYQGAKALEIWTGMTAPIIEMKEALNRAIYG